MKNNTMKVKIDMEELSVYELGYLTVDISQLLVFCKLLEERDNELLNKSFFNDNPFRLTRDSKVLKDYAYDFEVVDINKGCIEIIIGGVGAAATVIMPFVMHEVKKRNSKYKFLIDSTDKDLKDLLDAFEKIKKKGEDEENLKWLMEMLHYRGYDIDISPDNIYKIQKVIGIYARRIERIIR